MPILNSFLRSILTGPLAAVTKETGPSTWAPLANHTQALLQDLVLRNALRANASIAYRLQPLADEFLATDTLPPPDLLQVRRLLCWNEGVRGLRVVVCNRRVSHATRYFLIFHPVEHAESCSHDIGRGCV